ncbi:MAG: hypothetical protein AAFR38_10385 [Planctomycetota bacterium]
MPRGLILIASESSPSEVEDVIRRAQRSGRFALKSEAIIESWCACFGPSDFAMRVFSDSNHGLLAASAEIRELIQSRTNKAFVHTSTVAGTTFSERVNWRRDRDSGGDDLVADYERTVREGEPEGGDAEGPLADAQDCARVTDLLVTSFLDLLRQAESLVEGMRPRIEDRASRERVEALAGAVRGARAAAQGVAPQDRHVARESGTDIVEPSAGDSSALGADRDGAGGV